LIFHACGELFAAGGAKPRLAIGVVNPRARRRVSMKNLLFCVGVKIRASSASGQAREM
jgi:hypothetical protein